MRAPLPEPSLLYTKGRPSATGGFALLFPSIWVRIGNRQKKGCAAKAAPKGRAIMKFVIQRAAHASVTVDGQVVGKIGRGFLVLIGVCNEDTTEIADKMVRKMTGLRIFEDENGKTNLGLKDVNGELLLISQFTLYADCRKGNRPSFIRAGSPDMAEDMYEYIIRKCRETVPVVEQGIFGADMKVDLLNDGPFTIVLDSDQL